MALHHAGISHYFNGDGALAKQRLTRFLELYKVDDGFTQKAHRVTGRIEAGVGPDSSLGRGER